MLAVLLHGRFRAGGGQDAPAPLAPARREDFAQRCALRGAPPPSGAEKMPPGATRRAKPAPFGRGEDSAQGHALRTTPPLPPAVRAVRRGEYTDMS